MFTELLSSSEVHEVIMGFNHCMHEDCPKLQNTLLIIKMIQSYEHNMYLDTRLFCQLFCLPQIGIKFTI